VVISLINNKGGVGKTTTAVNLCAALASNGNTTLLVDLDSQGSASLSLGVPRGELSPSIADALFDDVDILDLIRDTSVRNLKLITGDFRLANADLALADVEGRERLLRDVLQTVRDSFDCVILDCPPSLSLLPINALTAADTFIVPVSPQYLALEGLVNLFSAVDRVRENIGGCAELLGIVITLADYRVRVTQEIVEIVREHYGIDVFETEIRGNVRLAEAPSFGQTVFQYDGASAGAEAYYRLAVEVATRSRRTL
jgi:chromosome partitioning protein